MISLHLIYCPFFSVDATRVGVRLGGQPAECFQVVEKWVTLFPVSVPITSECDDKAQLHGGKQAVLCGPDIGSKQIETDPLEHTNTGLQTCADISCIYLEMNPSF